MEEFDFHDRHGQGGDIAGLRAFLRHKFGNAARGWRMVIAPHGDHEAHDYSRAGVKATLFSDFCAGLKRIGYAGNGMTLWKELTQGKNQAWLEDLDPKLGDSLDAVAEGIFDVYPGGTQQAWNEIERDHVARATADEFEQFLYDRELLPDVKLSVRQVFECLAFSGRGTLTLEEFRFLDHWAARRLKKQLPEKIEPKQKEERTPWSPPPPKPPHVPDLKDFRKFLEQKFGSPARAWRVAIDLKAGGSVSPAEFGMACRQVGWLHPHKDLWNELACQDQASLKMGHHGGMAKRVVERNGQLVLQDALSHEAYRFTVPYRDKKFTLPGLPGGDDLKFKKEKSGGKKYLKTAAGKYVIFDGGSVRESNNPGLEVDFHEDDGVATLRGLDPATCSAIDTLVERMTSTFGDLETLWSEVLDPDGDGICSRAEWVKSISKELGLSGKAAGLIFTVVDVVHAGWIGYPEIGFLEDFMTAAAAQHDSFAEQPSDWSNFDVTADPKGMFASMSAGSIGSRQTDPAFAMTDLSWAETSLEGSASVGSLRRRPGMSSTHSLHLGSTQRSSRSMQNRQYANCQLAKYRWMGEAAAQHSRSMSDGSAWAMYKKEVEPNMPTVGGTPQSDVFRFTNEFYREGCRRLQHHHELQAARIDRRNSPQSSPASSQRSPNSRGYTPGSSRTLDPRRLH
jgi:hypothetical protein